MIKVYTLAIEQLSVNKFINNIDERSSYYITTTTNSPQSDLPQNTGVYKSFYNH